MRTLHRRLAGGFVVVHRTDAGRRDEAHGKVIYGGHDIALELLLEGLAWALPAIGDDERTTPYALAEQAARDAKRGLWSESEPIPPWTWRGDPPPRDGMLGP